MKNPSQIGENRALRDKMCPKSVKMEGTDFFTLPGRFGYFAVGDFGRRLARKWSSGGRSWEPGGSPSRLKINIFDQKLRRDQEKVDPKD